MKNDNKFIEVNKVSYSYPIFSDDENEDSGEIIKNHVFPALDKVELSIEKGQFICILGSNGSGKSTLARHLNALISPDEGSIWIDGKNSSDEKYLWDIRAMIGMVFQNPDNQFVASQVDEEVAFGLENVGVPSEDIQIRVKNALKAVGMDSHEKDNPGMLSGGQKQRIAVAGILAMKPECIVLDESTAMLDPKGRKEIMDTVSELNKRYGITIICITHFIEEAIGADKVFIMHKGRLLSEGAPRKVFSDNMLLKRAGLMPPVICQLAEELRKKGMSVPSDILTAKELKKYINEHYVKKH